MTRPLSHIVFDWNGTLFDDFAAVLDSFNAVFRHYGRDAATAEVFRQHYTFPFAALLQNHGFSADELMRAGEAPKHMFHDHYGPQEVLLGLREGAVDVLRQARRAGIGCLILSNHLAGQIAAHVRRLEIAQYFDAILAYPDRASQGHGKMTKGDMLKSYREERGLAAAAMLIVGDSVEEIHIGRQQGLTTAGITGGCTSEARLRAERPDYLIHSLHELSPLLASRQAA